MNRNSIIGILTVITVIFQHFQFASIAGYPLTIGFFTGSILVIAVSARLHPMRLTLVWAPLIAVTGFAALTAAVGGDFREHFGTLLLLLFSSFILVMGSNGAKPRFLQSPEFANALLLALLLVVGISAVQVVTGMAGSAQFFNPFGSHQYLYEYNPHFEFNPIPRAQGFYLEPSYDAFVIGSLTVALVSQGKHVKLSIGLAVAGLLSCQSATGLLLLLVIGMWMGFRSRPGVALAALAIVGMVVVASGPYLATRLGSIGDVGSSGNYRLVAPLEILKDVLAAHPIGQPLGSLDRIVSGYSLLNGAYIGGSLDNGYYVLVFYFGWLGVIAISLGLIYATLLALKHNRRSSAASAIVPVWIVGAMLFSGGIMLPEYAIMTWVALISYPRKSVEEPTNATIDRDLRNLPGRRRDSSHSQFTQST